MKKFIILLIVFLGALSTYAQNCNYSVSATLVAGQPNMIFFDYSNAGSAATNFTWNFGDGNSSTQPVTFHTYAQPGTYYYCLTIDNCPPVCDSVVVIPIPGCNPFFASVINNSTVQIYPYNLSGQYVTVVDWGDNSIDTLSYLTAPNSYIHTYANAGTYNVCFTHSNSVINCSNTRCETIVIGNTAPLQCNASFAVDTVNAPNNALKIFNTSTITGASAAANVSYAWDFGDGTTSNQPFPSHNYQTPGTYELCLAMAVSDNGVICTSSFCDSLNVIGGSLIILDPASIGIAESILNQTKIYPNPVTEILNISLPESTFKTNASMYNVNGKLVKFVQLENRENRVDVMDLPAGMYILRLQSQKDSHQIKFIKY